MVTPTSAKTMFSFKLLILIPTSVLSAAVALKLSAPDLAVSDLHSIYDGIASWFRPPYLYLVINCIIATIYACSKLQPTKGGVKSPPDTLTLAVLSDSSLQMDYLSPDSDFDYEDVVSEFPNSYDATVETRPEFEPKTESVSFPVTADVSPEDAISNKENEYAVSKSSWKGIESSELTESSSPNVRPLISTRFGHRRSLKSSPEVGKTVLGVSKPKKQDTLEATWKTITEGRAMPLTRHLKKSDTWDRNVVREKTPQKKTMMTKAETFNDRINAQSPSSGGGSSGRLRREPSLSHDELNRRVEAFIRKFNQEMRLQRQDSLKQHMEMVRRA